MKSIRLADRERGSEFSRFERKLIFDDAFTHVGFVKYLDSRHFILRKSLFTDINTGRRYRLPDGISALPDEGSFIEVDPDGSCIEIRMGRTRQPHSVEADSRSVVQVGSYREAKVPISPPNLPMDEFLDRVSTQWRNPEEDLLDLVIGLTIVSAPYSVYGRGGLGSEGFRIDTSTTKGTPRDVSDSIMNQLPVEFRSSGNRFYRYRSIDSLRAVMDQKRTHVREDCYSILKPRRMKDAMKGIGAPVQLPFTLVDSIHRNKKAEFDIDVLDYQLTALYLPPPPEKVVEDLALSTVEEAHQEAFFDMPGIGKPDQFAAVKLGLAVSRLHIGKQFTGSGYSRTRTDPSQGKDILDRLLKKGLETVRDRIREEELLPSRKDAPWRSRLKPLDKKIYYQLRSAYEEHGIEETPIEDVLPQTERRVVEGSLERLNRFGYVLYMKGGTIIKVVVGSHIDEEQ
ncbi:MAG: hypothetical protein R6V01_09905 [Thermoplasmatota archaeon]